MSECKCPVKNDCCQQNLHVEGINKILSDEIHRLDKALRKQQEEIECRERDRIAIARIRDKKSTEARREIERLNKQIGDYAHAAIKVMEKSDG